VSAVADVLRFQELPEEIGNNFSVYPGGNSSVDPNLQMLIVVGLPDVRFYNYLQTCMYRAGRTDRQPNARFKGLDTLFPRQSDVFRTYHVAVGEQGRVMTLAATRGL
jgi:hypothetical protein